MRGWLALVALLTVVVPAGAWVRGGNLSPSLPVAAGCAPVSPPGNTWYVTTGSGAGGDGSIGSPWPINSLFTNGGARLTSYPTPHAAPAGGGVNPGDTVLLETGSYGSLVINLGAVNSNWVTFAPAPGATVTLSKLNVLNVAINKLRFTGLTFRNDGVATGPLVNLAKGANLMIDHNDIANVDDSVSLAYTTVGQWEAGVTRLGVEVDGRTSGANCVTVANNYVHSSFGGLSEASTINDLITGNEFAYINRDMVDLDGDNQVVVGNYIHDPQKTSSSHADSLQGLISASGASQRTNLLVDSNMIIRQVNPASKFSDGFQGPFTSSGKWVDVAIVRNVVIGSAQANGISWDYASYELVAQNTVIWDGCTSSSQPACLSIEPNLRPFAVGNDHVVGDHIVAINNIASGAALAISNYPSGFVDPATVGDRASNNLVFDSSMSYWNGSAGVFVTTPAGTYAGNSLLAVDAPANVFVNLGRNAAGTGPWDLHLVPQSPAIGLGVASAPELTVIVAAYPNLALPTTDIEGRPYGTAVEAGAYAYMPGVVSPNNTVVLAGSTDTIVDANLNIWGINGAGQVVVNGVADTVTSSTLELAYVNGNVWMENNGWLWWFKNVPSDTWSPNGGTPVNPLPTAPVISAIAAGSITTSGATIAWTTNIAADSRVCYGTSAPPSGSSTYTSCTTVNASAVTSHSVVVSGLASSQIYHYQVRSAAGGNQVVSGDNTFSTTGSTTALADAIAQNTAGGSEGQPIVIGWYNMGALKETTAPPGTWTSMSSWGVVYQITGLPVAPNNATDTVTISNYEAYVHKVGGGWTLVQDQNAGGTSNPIDFHYQNDFATDTHFASTVNTYVGTTSYTFDTPISPGVHSPGDVGWNDHFFPEPRPPYAAGTIDGAFAMAQAKTNDSAQNIIMQLGGDWWITNSSAYCGVEACNKEMGRNNWLKLTTSYRWLYFTTLSSAALTADPPPPLQ